MSISPVKNHTQLFLKCIILSLIINIVFFIINSFNINKNPNELILYKNIYLYWGFSIIQILLNVFLGLYLKKNDSILISKEKKYIKEYKKCYIVIKIITITIILLFLGFIFFDDDIYLFTTIYLYNIIYDITGIEISRIINITNIVSILICLNLAFKSSKKFKINIIR